jgi:phospholipase C
MSEDAEQNVTRRQILERAGVFGAGALATAAMASWHSSPAWGKLVERAASTKPAGSDLEAVEHIVFLMMENRSYDHYFGAYHKGRGFDDHAKDSLGVFAQAYPNFASQYSGTLVPKDTLLPYRLYASDYRECTDDLTHDWGPMHECWNGGKMDAWVSTHTSSAHEGARGVNTMGYFTRDDIPFYYSLADNFTLLDGYHAAIIGPTHPNRLMAISGSIDPAGKQGGPIVATNAGVGPDAFSCTWTTMPELLQDSGVSWKCYTPGNDDVLGTKYSYLLEYPTWSRAFYDPASPTFIMALTDLVLPYFSAYQDSSSTLYDKAFNQTFPGQFAKDVAADALPSVSWVIPPLGFDEHPASAPTNGEWFTSLVLDALVSNPKVWSKTALFLMYDENDGWFDHVPPPVAPKGTADEYLTTTTYPSQETDPDTDGYMGPLGLGMRVPAMMISPFSRGGHIASEVFDHTSQLKLISKRFKVKLPNVSKWRRDTVGDLTSTLFKSATKTGVPKLPGTKVSLPLTGYCAAINQYTEASSGAYVGEFPRKQRMPKQGGGSEPASRYYKLSAEEEAVPDDAMVAIAGAANETLKSSYNRRYSELTEAATAR